MARYDIGEGSLTVVPIHAPSDDLWSVTRLAASADGSQFALSQGGGEFPPRNIATVQADGTGWSVITDGEYWNTDPAWLADDEAVIFASNRCCSTNGEFRYQLYTASRSDRKPRRLTTASANDLAPAASPDGTRVAFVRRAPGDTLAAIYVMRTDGSGLRRVLSERQLLQLGWIGPDALAFMTVTTSGASSTLRLMTVEINRPSAKPRTFFTCGDPCVGDDSFAVSPDGRLVAVSTATGDRSSSVVLVDVASGTQRALPGLSKTRICCVAWSALAPRP